MFRFASILFLFLLPAVALGQTYVQEYVCTPQPDRVSREWVPPERICTPYGACIVTRAGYWRTVRVPQSEKCGYRRVRVTPRGGTSGTTTTTTGFTNRNSSTGGWKAPAIETGLTGGEDCGYACEQEVLEARDRHNRGESSEDELKDEICTAIDWQTGHACGE